MLAATGRPTRLHHGALPRPGKAGPVRVDDVMKVGRRFSTASAVVASTERPRGDPRQLRELAARGTRLIDGGRRSSRPETASHRGHRDVPPPFMGNVELRLHPDDVGFARRVLRQRCARLVPASRGEPIDAWHCSAPSMPSATAFNATCHCLDADTRAHVARPRRPVPLAQLPVHDTLHRRRFLEEDGEVWTRPVAWWPIRQLALVRPHHEHKTGRRRARVFRHERRRVLREAISQRHHALQCASWSKSGIVTSWSRQRCSTTSATSSRTESSCPHDMSLEDDRTRRSARAGWHAASGRRWPDLSRCTCGQAVRCTVDPLYYDALSPTSKATLQAQGGRLAPDAYAGSSDRVRGSARHSRHDEAGKDADAEAHPETSCSPRSRRALEEVAGGTASRGCRSPFASGDGGRAAPGLSHAPSVPSGRALRKHGRSAPTSTYIVLLHWLKPHCR